MAVLDLRKRIPVPITTDFIGDNAIITSKIVDSAITPSKLSFKTYEEIAKIILTSDTSSISFTSIPTNYNFLRLKIYTGTTATSNQNLYIRFNNSTTGYLWQTLQGSGTKVSAAATTSYQNAGLIGYIYAGPLDAVVITDIENYGFGIHYNSFSGSLSSANNSAVLLVNGLWSGSGKVNTITILPASGNLRTNSVFILMGVE